MNEERPSTSVAPLEDTTIKKQRQKPPKAKPRSRGVSSRKQKRKSKLQPWDVSDGEDSDLSAFEVDEYLREEEGVYRYDLKEAMSNPKYEAPDDYLLMIPAKDFTSEFIKNSGLIQPMVFKEPAANLNMQMPDANTFDVADVGRLLGDVWVDLVLVATQTSDSWPLTKFIKYFQRNTKEYRDLVNCLSLEFSHSKMCKYVRGPDMLLDVDLQYLCWPQSLRAKAKNPPIGLDPNNYSPTVQNYCLMSVPGCYTDFHIDFAGSSVWYHVLKGKKIFWLAEPSPQNIKVFEEWSNEDETRPFFGDVIEGMRRVELLAGNTFILPSGWIHAVFTPAHSIVLGGNFLHLGGIPMQLAIYDFERRLKVHRRYRYPLFVDLLWMTANWVVQQATHTTYFNQVLLNSITSRDEAARKSNVIVVSGVHTEQIVDSSIESDSSTPVQAQPDTQTQLPTAYDVFEPEETPEPIIDKEFVHGLSVYEREGIRALYLYARDKGVMKHKKEVTYSNALTDKQALLTTLAFVIEYMDSMYPEDKYQALGNMPAREDDQSVAEALDRKRKLFPNSLLPDAPKCIKTEVKQSKPPSVPAVRAPSTETPAVECKPPSVPAVRAPLTETPAVECKPPSMSAARAPLAEYKTPPVEYKHTADKPSRSKVSVTVKSEVPVAPTPTYKYETRASVSPPLVSAQPTVGTPVHAQHKPLSHLPRIPKKSAQTQAQPNSTDRLQAGHDVFNGHWQGQSERHEHNYTKYNKQYSRPQHFQPQHSRQPHYRPHNSNSQPHNSRPHHSRPHNSNLQPHNSRPHNSRPHNSRPHNSEPHHSHKHQQTPKQPSWTDDRAKCVDPPRSLLDVRVPAMIHPAQTHRPTHEHAQAAYTQHPQHQPQRSAQHKPPAITQTGAGTCKPVTAPGAHQIMDVLQALLKSAQPEPNPSASLNYNQPSTHAHYAAAVQQAQLQQYRPAPVPFMHPTTTAQTQFTHYSASVLPRECSYAGSSTQAGSQCGWPSAQHTATAAYGNCDMSTSELSNVLQTIHRTEQHMSYQPPSTPTPPALAYAPGPMYGYMGHVSATPAPAAVCTTSTTTTTNSSSAFVLPPVPVYNDAASGFGGVVDELAMLTHNLKGVIHTNKQ